ncbi:MAG TPA: pitrilysin family protein [Mycobacteriales bacterium]|nr:pitrilysin family protein [Mycobacteriales bacterium]
MTVLIAQRPAAGEPRPYAFPAFARHMVNGGMVIACHLERRPIVSMTLVSRAGAAAEPAGIEGVANLSAELLGQGAGGMDAHAFAVAGERLGASWFAAVGWDATQLGFDVPNVSVPAAAALLNAALVAPALDPDELARLRDERLDELVADAARPRTRALRELAAALWQPGSRYALPQGGSAESVEAVDLAAVRRWHDTRLLPGCAALVLAGDLTGLDVESVGATVFEGWSGGAGEAVGTSAAPASGGRRVVVVHRPGSVQSALAMGHSGPARGGADEVALTTMQMALGGTFSSRLNYTLREKKGYTYGASAQYDLRRDAGIFVAQSEVKTEVTGAALTDAHAEILGMRDAGIRDDELIDVRLQRIERYPLAFASPRGVAGALSEIVVYGLSDDHYDRQREQIAAVTKEEVDAAGRRHLRVEDLVTVVVGDADVVAAELGGLDLGPVEVRADG